MSNYRAELYTKGVEIYNNTINEALFEILESVFDGYVDFTDFEFIQVIYSELSDEVDDEEYYDLGLDEDNHDIVNYILDYCYKYQIDKSLFAVAIGKYILLKDERHFNSYEDFHKAIGEALKASTTNDLNNDYVFLVMQLNEIVSDELNNKYPAEDIDY
ncbi:hypothetical protein [Sphingobacterium multivorum]|uniref:hypothetical protein n=1 Tax=Sphingobacterium multivorum TaxID=28454 RepID=UPI0028AA91C1|nr:hypothetical protein [Sphingobacterium multivorum]